MDEIKIDGIPMEDYGTPNSRTVYPYTAAEIEILKESAYNRGRADENINYRNYIQNKINKKIKQIKMSADYDWMFKYDYQDVIKILQELLED